MLAERSAYTLRNDISGAFDRVSAERLLVKCRKAGVNHACLKLLESFLAPRRATVRVEGAASDTIALQDTVFQGTRWGPPLWNTFFADVATAAGDVQMVEEIFADDLTLHRTYPPATTNDAIKGDLRQAQSRVHQWCNQVLFDPVKEELTSPC